MDPGKPSLEEGIEKHKRLDHGPTTGQLPFHPLEQCLIEATKNFLVFVALRLELLTNVSIS